MRDKIGVSLLILGQMAFGIWILTEDWEGKIVYYLVGGFFLALAVAKLVIYMRKWIRQRRLIALIQPRLQILRQSFDSSDYNGSFLPQHQFAEQPAISQELLKSLIAQSQDLCSICFEPLKTMNIIKTKCDHQFHKICIQQWLRQKHQCPLCRQHIA